MTAQISRQRSDAIADAMDTLEYRLIQVDQLASAASLVIENALGRQAPSGELEVLIETIRQHAWGAGEAGVRATGLLLGIEKAGRNRG